MFLAVTPLREFWDTKDELLFVGPWCVPYERRAELEGLKHRFLPDSWRDHDRFMDGVGACGAITERLLLQLVDYLNAAHGTSHGARYWRVLLNPWLAYHVQQLYGHWVHLEDAFAAHVRLNTAGLDAAQFQTPRDTMDSIRMAFGDLYQLQLYTVLLEALRPGVERRRAASPPVERLKEHDLREASLLRRTASRALGRFTPPGLGEVLAADLNLRREENLSLYSGSRLRILPYLAQLPGALKPEPVFDARRLGLAELSGAGAFERAVIAALPTHFPTLYLEGHAAASRWAMERVWRTPKAIFTAGGLHFNEALKFAAAECSERGSELWGLQHGGVYGLWEHADAEGFERSVSDRFYCWGWAETAHDRKVRDLPHPIFSRAAAAERGEDVVIVSTTLDFHDIRMIRTQQNEQAFDYIERQARLWTAVSAALPGKAYYRMYPGDQGWRHNERLKDLRPDVRFDDSSAPFSERAASARLLIFDNPMTTFLEAMGADRPCLLTWNPAIWRFRKEAKPWLDGLRAAGILIDEPEAAARRAAEIHADPRAWWDEPARREAHRAFAKRYACASKDWLETWLKELR